MSKVIITTNLLESLRGITKMLSEARVRAEERAIATHERFNIFTTLLKVDDEVRLHTRFLHCLLDPNGSHDCDSLFLDLFFATLTEIKGVDHDQIEIPLNLPEPGKPWVVEKEAYRSPYGQIDILLEQAGFGLAIENKINAYEQPNQLSCYFDYLNEQFGCNSHLIYLTLDGKPGYTNGERPYLRISYSDHILTWLDKCLRETYNIIPINQVLLQYREVVRHLTGKTLESATMKTISEFIYQNPDIVRFNQEINDGIAAVRATFLDRLADGIMERLQDKFQLRFRSKLNQGRFGTDPYGALIITPQHDSPLSGAPFEIWVQSLHKWGNAFLIGIESEYEKPKLTTKDNILLERLNHVLAKACPNRADPGSTWSGTYWPTGWYNILPHPVDDKQLADLLSKPIEVVISDVCTSIRVQISMLETAYTEAMANTQI